MSFPENFDPSSIYIPDPPGVREHNLGDLWRGVWVAQGEIPEGLPLNHAFILLFMAGKGYVVRESEAETWGTLETDAEAGESVEAMVTRAISEQTGATLKTHIVTGYLDCKATSHNPDYAVGSRVARPMVVAVASEIADQRPGSKFMRRRLPANEYIATLRKKYPEFQGYFGDATNRYLIMHARGEG